MRLFVEQWRSGQRETCQEVSAVLVEGEQLRWQLGEDFPCFWRSGCKPMQLTTSLEHLPPELLGWLKEEDLALGSASHSGEPEHVARVLRLLRHFRLKTQQLRCGAHLPLNEVARDRLLHRRLPATTLHSNCSGKHSFMLAASKHQGWDLNYLPLEHPLQQANYRRIAEWSGQSPGTAVDGCGVPTFHLPLVAMARAFSRLAAEMNVEGSLAGRIGWAMHRHPWYMSGTGRLDRAVVQGAKEPLTVKVGAEGLFSIALPQRSMGLVIKVHGGTDTHLAVGVRAVLEELFPGILGETPWPWAEVRNIAGLAVGERRARWVHSALDAGPPVSIHR